MALHPIILAGGSGTRLWPLSREHYPKPFLSLTGERSLFQDTIGRLDGIADAAPPIIVCNEEHRFLVAEQTRQAGKTTTSIILEPEGRNTAPALTLAALLLADRAAADPVILVMPADHVIRDVATFQSVVRIGTGLAEAGCLVTFGVVPTSPSTAYGYIKKGPAANRHETVGAFCLDGFVEKPEKAAAERMLESEGYLWNSGIFMMRLSLWLGQLELHRPDIALACLTAHAGGHWDGDFYRPDPSAFLAGPSDSIDYAVMERVADGGKGDGAEPSSGAASDVASSPSPDCVVLPMDAGWSDIGAWSALWDEGIRDSEGNVTRGDVYTQSMRNSLLIGQHRLLAAVGLEDVIVVETADAVLVAHKDHVQEVKALVARLKSERRPEQEAHRAVHRPWGTYETVDSGPGFKVKRLTVNPGASLSLQMHHHRAEHWVVVKGTARVTKGGQEFSLSENESTYVPVGVRHRLENSGSSPLEVVEVSSGSYLEEDDIVRFEDRYNRQDEAGSSP